MHRVQAGLSYLRPMKDWGVEPSPSTLAFPHEALAGIKGAEGLSGGHTLKVRHPDTMALRQAGRNQKGVGFILDRCQMRFSHIVCSLAGSLARGLV